VVSQAVCFLGDGTQVSVYTFSPRSAENSWTTDQGQVLDCCVQGNLWAALVDANVIPSEPDWQKVIGAVGGREVSNIP
jgi:hypothetical protein